jgi:SAM-dependent MidA family methyltransferase
MKMPDSAICEEILKNGVISFARFMELALYCPESGYYESKKDRIGRRGDFITSVSVGSFFGELLAFQFAEWLKELPMADGRWPVVEAGGKAGSGSSSSSSLCGQRTEHGGQRRDFSIVEAGAHEGRLAVDILAWLQANQPELFERIEYVIIEPSVRRKEWQQETLKCFAPRVRWLANFSESSSSSPGPLLPHRGAAQASPPFNGIIFSNELLDAFPVHRFGWDAARKAWFEWSVGLQESKLIWVRSTELWTAETVQSLPVAGEPPALSWRAAILDLPSSLLAVLPDGYVVEAGPAASHWWREAAARLACGKLLTIDYGHAAEEMFSPARLRGTLRAYQRHRVTDDLLANPGGQDLTAHVNFAALQTAGEAAGLRTEQFCTQSQFLTRIFQKAVAEKSFTPLDAAQVRQFQTLTHPEHLGRSFRVLVQRR